MKQTTYSLSVAAMAAALVLMPAASAAPGQVEFQVRVGQKPGWNPGAREGRCEVRVWVDHAAELRMRGDGIFVRTLEGGRSYDEGSSCSSPIPYNAVSGFQLRQMAGRNRVDLRQEPDRRNNYTALISINDDQGGGDHYAFEVSWRGEGNRPNDAPAPFFDDIRACQDSVRQRFLSKNGRGTYIDFSSSADRRDQDRDRERIEGRGDARSWNDSRNLTYSCVIETRTGRVRSADYRYESSGGRGKDRGSLK